jgi:hypothetical protein
VNQSGGDQRAQRQAARAERQAARQQAAPRIERQQMRVERQAAPRFERQQMRAERQQRVAPQRVERQQLRAERQQRVAPARVERQQLRAERQQRVAPTRVERQQARVERQQRANRTQQAQVRQQERQQIRANRTQQAQVRQQANVQAQNRMAAREQLRTERMNARENRIAGRNDLLVQRQALRADRIANNQAFQTSRIAALTTSPTVTTRFIAPAQAVQYVGQPLNVVSSAVPLMVLPASVSYLYPDTPDYYYRYGDGYLYQVDRGSSLIAALIPLLAGGFMPGTYLPNYYMNSYVPNYYGLNSFYPSSYSGYDYGYGYDNLCNRYANGVIYRVDCYTGMIVDVVPMYAGGYGVGQLLPSSYSYYNVPYQYRDMYYDTPDYGYWYAPGAIYQYDQRSSLITSVAALMSPGFSIGQPLPMGYDVYNVPYAYRATYYDTPTAWYRYNNGYIYQVDPTTQLVSAIVASVLRA